MRKSIYAMMMGGSMLLASCSKNNEQPEEKKETPSATISDSKLVGKWELTSLDWIYYKTTGQEDYRSSYTNSSTNDPKRTWITFNRDKSYVHTGKDQGSVGTMLADIMPPTGEKWALTNGNKAITLNAKEWNVTKFENSQMQIEYNKTASNGTKSKIILLFVKD